MTTHTPVTFTVKAYNAKGEWVTHAHYHTPKLNSMGGHWTVCQRIASRLLSEYKKAKTVRYFMDDIEYVYSDEECDFVKA